MSDWQTYREAVTNASPEVRTFLGSDKIAKLIDKIDIKSKTDINRQKYLILISDYLLSLATVEQIKLQLTKDLAPEMVQESLQQIISLVNVTDITNIDARDQNEIVGVHTMADDVASVQSDVTESLSQDDLLRR